MKVSIGAHGRVAVIGAGAGGLCAAHFLRDYGNSFRVTVFEATSRIGGTWNFSEHTDTHSSMYRSLRTNHAKEVMRFRELPFEEGQGSFVGHADVIRYLHAYADEFQLRGLVRFGTSVERVWRDGEPTPADALDAHSRPQPHWRVQLSTGATESFHAVVVCNGHYSVPHVPKLPGLRERFRGDVMHSHNYRTPDRYAGKRVMLLGAGPSGTDISLDMLPLAAEVYLSHSGYRDVPEAAQEDVRSGENGLHGKRICHCPPLVSFDADGLAVLADDSRVHIDCLLLCTGYEYTFPFLDPSLGVHVGDRFVYGLHRHLVWRKDPTLSFLGLPWNVVPFPMMEYQSRFVTDVLHGRIDIDEVDGDDDDLPPRSEPVTPVRYGHRLGAAQWEYNRRLADRTHAAHLPPSLRAMHDDTSRERRVAPRSYRERDYTVLGDGEREWRVRVEKSDVTPY